MSLTVKWEDMSFSAERAENIVRRAFHHLSGRVLYGDTQICIPHGHRNIFADLDALNPGTIISSSLGRIPAFTPPTNAFWM